MSTFQGVCLRLLHGLRFHEWLGASLERWLQLILLALAGLALLRLLPGGPVLGVALLALVLLLALGQAWARRRLYVYFVPAKAAAAPPQSALAPHDKLLVRATGLFAVDGQETAWTDLVAYYRTFATREHAIMARRTPSRLLGFAERDPDALGMWYLFVTPPALVQVRPGELYFGRHPRSALRLDYHRRTPKGKTAPAVAYLSFDSAADRQTVWADLVWDTQR